MNPNQGCLFPTIVGYSWACERYTVTRSGEIIGYPKTQEELEALVRPFFLHSNGLHVRDYLRKEKTGMFHVTTMIPWSDSVWIGISRQYRN